MNNKLKKEVTLYLKETSKLISANRTLKKVVLNDLKNNIYDLYNNNAFTNIEDVYNRFGTPSEISKSFNELSTVDLIKKAKLYKIIGISSIVFIISLIVLLFFIFNAYLGEISIIN